MTAGCRAILFSMLPRALQKNKIFRRQSFAFIAKLTKA